MLFNSIHFLIFLPIVIGLYCTTGFTARKWVILAASYYFYMVFSIPLVLLLIWSTFVDFLAAQWIEKAETDFQFLGLGIPTHGHSGATPIAKLRPAQRRSPFLRFDTGHTGQLLGEHALFQGELFVMGQVLHAATAAAAKVRARCRAA